MCFQTRSEFKTEFEGLPNIQQLSRCKRPRDMTHELAVASGEREEANQAEDKTKKQKKEESLKEPYHGVDIYTKELDYMDKVVQNVNDPMHEIANTIKDILNLLMNEGSMKYTDARRTFEQGFALHI